MKKPVLSIVVSTIILASTFSVNASEEIPESFYMYDEAGEAAKRTVDNIHQALKYANDWSAIQISGLYIRLKEEILEAVKEDGEKSDYQISEIEEYDKQYFLIRIKPTYTIYVIKKGDTLSRIAREYETTVDKLLELNPYIKDKDLIFEGAVLKIK